MSNKSKRRNNKRQKKLKNIEHHKRQIRSHESGIKQLKIDRDVLDVMHKAICGGDDLTVKEEAENLAISVWAYYKIKEKDLKKQFLNGGMSEVISILDRDRKQRLIICDLITKSRISLIFGPKIPSICREAQIDIWEATINPKDDEHPLLKTFDAGDGLHSTVNYPDDWDKRHKNHCFVSRCVSGMTFQTVEGRIFAENCKWHHDGPKTIEINNHQYEALKHVDLKIDSSILRTPYPVFRVKLPSNVMRRARGELEEFKLFDYVICSYEDSIFKMYMPGTDDSIYYFDSLDEDMSLEDLLMEDINRYVTQGGHRLDDSNEKVISRSGIIDSFTRDLLRVIWNLSLLMTNGYTKHTVRKKQLQSDNKYPRECDFEEIVSFEQNVCTIGSIRQSDGHDGDPIDGSAKRPHWRKAHWRQQRCGPGGRDRKAIFIHEVFVRSDLFSGDISDTGANYKKSGTGL